jgi:hypothetical protein
MNNQPLNTPITFLSDINKRGRKRDDSSFPKKSAAAPTITVSLPKKTCQTQLHVVFLECLSEGRVRKKRGK